MHPRGRIFRYPQGRGSGGPPDVPGMLPYEMGSNMPLRDPVLSQHVPIGALASSLANAAPELQRTVRNLSFTCTSWGLVLKI